MKDDKCLISRLESLALTCGATGAAAIPVTSIVTSADFRRICESNCCGKYNRCWVCPPHIGQIDDLILQIRQYPSALLYQTVSPLEDSFDIEGMLKAGAHHASLSQRLQRACTDVLKENFLHLTCGGCHLCEQCAKLSGEPCRQPEKALPSLEGYGVDVYQTVRNTGLRYINGVNTVTYFGMILFNV